MGVSEEIKDKWRKRFREEEVIWFLVDGFVLYWHPVSEHIDLADAQDVVDLLNVKLFLRVPHDILKKRREERQTYVLQSGLFPIDIRVQPTLIDPDDAAAGGVWVDPPNYFTQIVYPGYIEAHKHIFEGDVEDAPVKAEWASLVILTPEDGEDGMTRAVEESCQAILETLNA